MSIKFSNDENVISKLINNCVVVTVSSNDILYTWQTNKLDDTNIESTEFVEFIQQKYKNIYDSMIKITKNKILNCTIVCHGTTYHHELCMQKLKVVLDILQISLSNGYSVGEILSKFVINSSIDYSSLIVPCADKISEIITQSEKLNKFIDTL